MMKITYLYHSGFAVELAEHVLIFDYFKGSLPKWDKSKTVLVFASHKHQDHFNLKIFDLYKEYQNIYYFVGSDIRLNEQYLERNGIDRAVRSVMTRTGGNTLNTWQDVTVETLRSTDAGVAFMVTTEGKTIYHGGDLNWWHWEEEPDTWNKQMEKDYKKEISLIAGRHFDAAFVPLDPRLEQGYDLGIKVFLENTDADAVFPMHMWDEYSVIPRFKKSPAGQGYADKVFEITRPGQEFIL